MGCVGYRVVGAEPTRFLRESEGEEAIKKKQRDTWGELGCA